MGPYLYTFFPNAFKIHREPGNPVGIESPHIRRNENGIFFRQPSRGKYGGGHFFQLYFGENFGIHISFSIFFRYPFCNEFRKAHTGITATQIGGKIFAPR
jgi:hypothetical protein